MTTWAYDVLSLLTAVTHPDGSQVSYTFDPFGRRGTVTTHIDAADLTGKTVTYAYDEDGRFSTLTDWQSHVTQYSYDELGRVETIQLPNGITSSYTYDAVGRLTDLIHTQDTNTLAAYHYAYDAVGNPVGANETWLGRGGSETPPTQFGVLEQGYMAISLAWPDGGMEETGYRLERSTDNQQHWQVIADLPANTLRYVDEGLSRHTRYWYRLTPYDGQGDGVAQTIETETGMQPVSYPTGEARSAEITYTYDALQRLTTATYDDGTTFLYTYDAAGNTLQREQTVSGLTSTTVYTYDEANQLVSAQEGSGTTWQYHYDGNGSLVEMTPGAQAGNGARRYSYNPAGMLTKVEMHDGTSYQVQAEMAYDGQGQRLALTAYSEGQSLTSHYLLDGQTTVAATAAGQTTYYLTGIGEYQAEWRYYLADGSNSVRQVSDGQGQVIATRSFTPWGEVLEQSGEADLTTGYLGGMLDGATGLIYLGNGQYYDPVTGRFLTRGVHPNQTNPYVPWSSDPAGAMLAPLALLTLIFGRKKQRGKGDYLVIVVVLCLTAAMGLAACGGPTLTPTEQPTSTPTTPPTFRARNRGFTSTYYGATTTVDIFKVPSDSPLPVLTTRCDVFSPSTATPTSTQTPTPTSTHTPTRTPTSTLLPPPTKQSETQMREYIASFGITLIGNWTGEWLTNIWEALFQYIGNNNLTQWLHGEKVSFIIGGAADCKHVPTAAPGATAVPPSCYSGYSSNYVVTFYHTNQINPVINMLHEIGHLMDYVWGSYFTRELKNISFVDEYDQFMAGWDGNQYKKLNLIENDYVRNFALKSRYFKGTDAWQQRDDGGHPEWEDWADFFSNYFAQNINQNNVLGGQMYDFTVKMENHVKGSQ